MVDTWFDIQINVFIVPGPVRHLHENQLGSNYVVLKWLPPEEPNGILMGYDIGYQPSKLSHFVRDVCFL